MLHRIKLFNAVITPSVLYGLECWAMTLARVAKLKVVRRKMLRRMIAVPRRAGARGGQEGGSETSSTDGETNAPEGTVEEASDDGSDTDVEDTRGDESWVD